MRGPHLVIIVLAMAPAALFAQDTPPAQTNQSQDVPAAPLGDGAFKLGEIVNVLAKDPGLPGLGGTAIVGSQAWTLEKPTLDQVVNVAPGVSSNFDSNGRRNESDIFVRGFGRWQVPLTVDGVRIYLPADNRLDFGRFLTSDIAAVQIQKGYASVLDGPGGMGGAINLVSRTPTKPFEAEAGISGGGRSGFEGSNGYLMLGRRQARYYLQGGAAYSKRDRWTLSNDYQPTSTSLQSSGERLSSDTRDWRINLKAGYTPTASSEYALNYTKQSGAKGAPLNVYNNPPVPANSFWRWPYWDVQNISLLTHTQLASTSYVKAKAFYNIFANGLDAYDTSAYTTQSANGRFYSPYYDHAYGTSIEFGTTPIPADTIKVALHYRNDIHTEQQTNRPTNPGQMSIEPKQTQSQYTWSIAAENTFHVSPVVDVVGGVSFEKYAVTKAEEFNTTNGLFELPKGGSHAVGWQAAGIWRFRPTDEVHASISDRARFPVIFELYSTRFGTATANPDLGPERATNIEIGWKGDGPRNARLAAAAFYSRVRDLIQTVVLPDTTTQTQNVGTGDFYGTELSIDGRVSDRLNAGANYTFIHRSISDALQPNLEATGVPTHKAFLYGTWRAIDSLTITPSMDIAGDRWSDVTTNPVQAFPFVRTGAYAVVNLDATYSVERNLEMAVGLKNMFDQNYELAWGFPQPGRTFYIKTRVTY